MYVDKRLDGVQAVQTLSRLSRSMIARGVFAGAIVPVHEVAT